jgi:nucleoside-diphosphate-sugar epimerase
MIMTADRIQSVAELEERLTRPSPADCSLMKRLEGDILILGAGGKMGPSLAKLARRAADAAGGNRRIIAVSRFGSAAARRELESAGISTIPCDLLDRNEVAALPACENVLYLAGRKFGSQDRPDLTWAMNAIAPSLVADHFRGSRMVVFSTGNVYSFREIVSGGARESDELAPVGEYAQSCLARERVFEYYSREHGTKCLLFRLNYAVDLRYGVLVDVARKVFDGQPVDLTVPAFNVIWQGDANSYALRSLEWCASPPRILNITGGETVRVREAAQFFGERFQRPPVFRGSERRDALLSDSSQARSLMGPPAVEFGELLEWVAAWVASGGETLNKPTHFEVADGRF